MLPASGDSGIAREMALASGVTLEIRASAVRFLPGAIEYSKSRRAFRRIEEQSGVRGELCVDGGRDPFRDPGALV